ncbi:hypothetical protein GN956_G17696 [Arapaima gigas]
MPPCRPSIAETPTQSRGIAPRSGGQNETNWRRSSKFSVGSAGGEEGQLAAPSWLPARRSSCRGNRVRGLYSAQNPLRRRLKQREM